MIKALEIRVHGHVQGVWFRQSTLESIQKIGGITGYVKNEPDGTVLIVAEGEEALLKDFLDWCEDGPAHARVNQVKTKEIPLKGYEGFRVRY